ncbi:MAG: hypothetical protein K2P17_00455 [Helicobacteraceae bacterium]|nr:hypothetical protein [Helicobacteraceae bacterium]
MQSHQDNETKELIAKIIGFVLIIIGFALFSFNYHSLFREESIFNKLNSIFVN